MAKMITRTFTTTTARIYETHMANGNIVADFQTAYDIPGKVDPETAVKMWRKAYGIKKGTFVADCEYTDQLRGMTVEDFIKYSAPVEKTTGADDE